MKRQFWCLVLIGIWSSAYGWEEQRVLDFTTAHNPILQAQRVVTEEYTPPNGVMARMKEYTSIYGRAGAGGTDFVGSEDEPVVLQVGIQINVPLATTKERRERALKTVEEFKAVDDVRAKVLADMAQLRQQEAELKACRTRLKFYEEKSQWLQRRVDEGFSNVNDLWTMGQKLTEERAAEERLKILIASVQYQLASYAGHQSPQLLSYLQGKNKLR